MPSKYIRRNLKVNDSVNGQFESLSSLRPLNWSELARLGGRPIEENVKLTTSFIAYLCLFLFLQNLDDAVSQDSNSEIASMNLLPNGAASLV